MASGTDQHLRLGPFALWRVALCGLFIALIIFWFSLGSESREITRIRFSDALVEEVIPKRRIELRGHIALQGFQVDSAPDESVEQEPGHITVFRHHCDAKCAALLAIPGVESVSIIADGERERAVTRFRLIDKSQCPRPSILPQNPDALRSEFGRVTETEQPMLDHEERSQAGIVARRNLENAWRIRLSAEQCIVADKQATKPDFIIKTHQDTGGYRNPEEWKWTYDQLPISDHQLEIRDSSGAIVMRRQFISVPILDRPIGPGFVASCGDLCGHVGWSRSKLANYEPDESIWQKDDELLLKHTNLGHGLKVSAVWKDVSRDAMAASLRAALDDAERPVNDPAFGLADSWMRSLNRASLTDADIALLIALIEDDRVTTFQGMWHASRVLGQRVAELEAPIKRRLARDFERPEVVTPLSAQLVTVTEQASPETLAEGPSEDDLAILNDPERRLHARGLIIRQSAYGRSSVALLLTIMREHVQRTARARAASPNAMVPAEIGPIDAAMVALCRLGPDGKSAVPEIIALQNSWLNRQFMNDREWQFTLARIGVPLTEIRKPQGLSGTQEEFEKNLRRRLAQFDMDRDCRGSWT